MSVGETLRQAREAKGLSLEDIKNSTQIMTRQLQEMEHDDFSSFAAPIYAKGFIRRSLGKRMIIRYAPELIFVSDKNIEYGVHIAKVLSETIKTNDDGGEPDETES